MLIWVCAFHAEARPVIEHWRLKKMPAGAPFDCYRGDDVACVLSGAGKIAAAAASAWAGASLGGAGTVAWINLGIAGADKPKIGATFQLDQIVDADSGERHYPVLLGSAPLPTATCISLARASFDYHPEHLYDMEASGYFSAASRFSSAELVQAIKLVSDNREDSIARNRGQISDAIAAQLPALEAEAERLQQLASRIDTPEHEPGLFAPLTQRHHFSQTQQIRLRRLLHYFELRRYDADALANATASCRDGKAILATLERLSRQDSEGL